MSVSSKIHEMATLIDHLDVKLPIGQMICHSCLFKTNLDQVCFVGVQLVKRSIFIFFPYQILQYTAHYSSTLTKQT